MDSGFEIKYRKLFRTYYANLLFYAKRIVGDDDAEDVVQDVFVELWHRKKTKITDEQRRCVKMHPFFLLRTKPLLVKVGALCIISIYPVLHVFCAFPDIPASFFHSRKCL